MTLFLRQFALTILIGLAYVPTAQSEDWPTRNVSVVIPPPPGVASDTTARIVFEQVAVQRGIPDYCYARRRWITTGLPP
jgi:tripartite-type tricarboxylate transporter receptor subunit TctC